jgi:hypothetical protein
MKLTRCDRLIVALAVILFGAWEYWLIVYRPW